MSTLLRRFDWYGVQPLARGHGDPLTAVELRRALAIAQAVDEWWLNTQNVSASQHALVISLKLRADELLLEPRK